MFINAPTDNLTLTAPWPRVHRDLLDRFAKAPAANIGDVFDRLLVMDGGIRPFTSSTRLVGTALPIHTRAGDNLAIHRALDDAQPGDVLVINGQGDLSRALIGDLIGEIMVNKGVLGAVIDGAVRDAETLAAQGLVVFARAATPAGPFKNGPGLIGSPVAVGGVVVSAGDLIVADADGVVLVPRDRAAWAAGQVDQVIEKEEALRRRIVAARGQA
jgi:regulator of RNase E activity RraA